MGRFLLSWLAGGLLVLGAWYGWVHPDSVDDAVTAATLLDPAAATEATPPPSSTVPTCAVPAPRDARGMNALFTGLDGQPTLLGADHGGSVALADGRRIFTFGDTIRDPHVVRPTMVRNSLLIADGSCLHAVTGPDDGAVIPDDGAVGSWPMSLRAIPDDEGSTVQIMASRVRGTGGDELEDFETLGSELVTFEVPAGGTPELVSRTPLGPRTSDPSVPTWGAAMWDDGDWVHVFGTASNASKTTHGWSLHVARARPADLGRPSAWQYWDGADWITGDPQAARTPTAQLIGPDHGVSHALSVFERDGTWYAVSKEGDYHGNWLTVWTSPAVTGPWVPHRVRELANDEDTLRYAALAHPDVDTASGLLLVSWSEAPTDRDDFVERPRSYRPRFAEIELP